MKTAYRCRAYPDQAQQAVLAHTFGCVRVVWNRTRAARQARWQQDGKSTSYAESDAALTAMKKDPGLAFLREVRHWTCPSCGTGHDRDVNAAMNILAAGLAVSACGAGVRHLETSPVRPAVKQEPSRRRLESPSLQDGE